MAFKAVKTPCIGVCSTGIGDDVCRGCKRFSHEVIDWNAYSHEQRLVIAERLESFLSRVVRNHIEILDESMLVQQLERQRVRFKPEQNPYCWVFELLRAGASQIRSPRDFGVQLKAPWQETPLTEVRDLIDREYYELSCAYYERYIEPGLEAETASGRKQFIEVP